MPRHLPKRDHVVLNRYWFKLLNLWSFVMQQQKMSTLFSSPLPGDYLS